METIAVTQDQIKALLAEAKRRAKKTKVEGGYKAYFRRVRGKVPSETDNKTSCAGHKLVRVVCGLRERAGIVHKSQGKVHFAPKTKLARDHPRGVACFMEPSGMTAEGIRRHLVPTIRSRRRIVESGSLRELTAYKERCENDERALSLAADHMEANMHLYGSVEELADIKDSKLESETRVIQAEAEIAAYLQTIERQRTLQ
jgi:hypothetical protein